MKTVSTEIFNAIHKRSRQFSLLLDFGDFEITKAENYSQEVISSPSSGLTFGTVAIGTGSFELKKQTVDVAGKTFRAFLGVKVSNEFEQVKLGKFTVTDVQEKGIKTEVTFEDDIALLDKTFDRKLTTPAKAVDVLDAVASICGVSFDLSNVPEDLTIEKPAKGFVCREIVGWIAQLLGTFVAIDTSTEKICFKWYEDTGYTINKDNYLYMVGEPTTDTLFELGAISCNTGTETLTASVDNTQGVVSLSNPFMTQAKLNALLEQRKGFSYNGGELAFVLGNPLLDVWDVVTVEYAGKTSVFPCMSLSLAFSGAVTGGMKSFVRDANTSFEGTITKEINGIKTRVTVLDGILKTEIVHNDEVITSINASKEGVKIKGEHLDLEGQVTFSSLNDEVKTAIDTAGEDAEAAKTAASEANKVLADWCYENDKTVIDGGKVAAGTVTAKQINVADLFAKNINMTGKFLGTAKAFIRPSLDEIEQLRTFVKYGGATSAQLKLYDLNCDGSLTTEDIGIMMELANGYSNISDYSSYVSKIGDVTSTISITINPADPDNVIVMTGTSLWGFTHTTSMDINGFDDLRVTNLRVGDANVNQMNADSADIGHIYTPSIWLTGQYYDDGTTENGQFMFHDERKGEDVNLVPLIEGLTGNVQEQLDDKVSYTPTNLGSMANKTIPELQAALDGWLSSVLSSGAKSGARATFDTTNAFVSWWNAGNTTSTLPAGITWTVELVSTYPTKDYVQLMITTYSSKQVYYVTRSKGTWQNIYKVAFTNDIPTYTLSSFGLTATATELNYVDGVTSNIQTQLNGKAAKVVVLFDGSASNQLIQGQSVSINMSAYRSIRVYYHMPGSGGVKETHMMYKTGVNQYPDYYYDGIYAPTPDNIGTGTRIMCMLWGINEAKTTFTVRRCGWFDNPSSTWNERANSDYAVIRIEGVI